MANLFYVAILALFWQRSDGLECYECAGVLSTTACNISTTCADNQGCYSTISDAAVGQRIDMGCKPTHRRSTRWVCYIVLKTYNECTSGVSIVGRDTMKRQTPHSCLECCSHDLCNINLCSHLKPSACVDDETVDCLRMSSIFSICSDIHHAKSVCPKTCDLCQLVDGNWASWSNWSVCDSTCGNGTQTRIRTCSDPAPAYGGHNCTGDSIQHLACVKPPCPVHGGWSLWSEWGACSVTCGIGLSRRNRTCSNPYPSLFGNHCFGDAHEDQACMPAPCTNGGWSTWGSWDACSVSCGTGLNHRYRTCDNPTPSPYGHPCVGTDTDINICTGSNCNYEDCFHIKQTHPNSNSGIYTVSVGAQRIQVYCDMVTDRGGWTVFQRRFNGSVDFYRTFADYENGFGDLHGEHWLGLNYIYPMTNGKATKLRLDLMAADGNTAYEVFTNFHLSTGPDYTLHIDPGTGTAGDSTTTGLSFHNGATFSTKDYGDTTCAINNHGGWWYNNCDYVNLNGEYATPGTVSSHNDGWGGVIYNQFTNLHSLKETKMMFRPM